MRRARRCSRPSIVSRPSTRRSCWRSPRRWPCCRRCSPGASWLAWIERALVLLVVACPCALVIATPVAMVSALSAAARRGLLLKGGAVLERLAAIRVVALDKTGTVSEGRLRITAVTPLGGVPGGARRATGGVGGGRRPSSAGPGDRRRWRGIAAWRCCQRPASQHVRGPRRVRERRWTSRLHRPWRLAGRGAAGRRHRCPTRRRCWPSMASPVLAFDAADHARATGRGRHRGARRCSAHEPALLSGDHEAGRGARRGRGTRGRVAIPPAA